MNENRNMILAIVLSAIVLIGWQYFFAIPQIEQQKREAAQHQQTQQQTQQQPSASKPSVTAPGAPQDGATVPGTVTREQALAASPRVPIETPFVK